MKQKYIKYIILFLSLIALFTLIFNGFDLVKKCYLIAFHKSGVISHFNESGQLDGEADTYIDGQIVRKSSFKNGLYDGWLIDYYSNGVMKRKFFYKANKINGLGFEYYENGQIKIESTFKNGRYDGSRIHYYQNRKIENKSFYKDDRLDGKESGYYENGNLKYSRYWINNNPYGDFNHYYENKQLEGYHTYDILGEKFYISRYDQTGKPLRNEGNIFSGNIYSKDKYHNLTIILKDNTRYKNICDFYLTVANPPDFTTKFRIVINDKLRKDFTIDGNTVKISNVFLNKGLFRMVIDGIFVDKSNTITNSLTFKTTIIKE